MSLPTRDNLLTMDYSYFGQPFVQVPAKSIDTNTMDYSYLGEPFWTISMEGGGEEPSPSIIFRRNFNSFIQRIGTRTVQ